MCEVALSVSTVSSADEPTTSDVNEHGGEALDHGDGGGDLEGEQPTVGRPEDAPRSMKDALIPDHALPDATGDALGHDAFAAVIADLVVTVKSPANVALFGPWGSGKSSLYGMVKARVAPRRWPWKPWPYQSSPRVRMVRYDAWKFAGHSLQRNFLSLVASELKVSQRLLDRLYGARETARLRLGRYLWRNKWSLLLALMVGVVVGVAWTVLSAWAAHRWGVGVDKPVGFQAGVVKALPSGGVVVGAVLAALLLGNQAMASAVEKRSQSPLQDADQFSAAFDKLMRVVTRRRVWWWLRVNRLVVFIDELDRCQSHEVVATLRDLITFLDHKNCVFLVAADREVLEEALEKAPQVKPLRENEPYYSTAGAFLDKVFQHQMPLPPTRAEALTVYARDLADARGGLWAALRDDRTAYEDVVYSLVPAHVRSPRRVKVLMNNFVTAAHVLESRGLDSTDRAAQVAVLTVLQTEFPSVVRDFLQQPRLLEGLLGLVDDASDELKDLVKGYDPENGAATPSPLMTSDGDSDRRAEAQRRLNDQLAAYLGKVHAAGIPLPTPDLVYSRTAAHADGLADEALARLLDVAADTAPDTVVAEFEEASMGDRQAAVLFLVSQLGNKFGPLRANLVESACRIGASLDVDHAREVARRAAGAILGEVRTSRWRTNSTTGALWLGLLDPQTIDPLALFEGTGELPNLANSGALASLMPLIPDLGERADLLFPYIGGAYAARPDFMHDALRTFSSGQIRRLWASNAAELIAWFSGVALLQPPPITTSATRAGAPTPVKTADTPTPTEAAEARYADLLTALVEHPDHDFSDVTVDIAMIGLANETIPSLRTVLWEHRNDLFNTITDPAAKTRLALVALANVDEPDRAEVLEWSALIDPKTAQDPVQVQVAAERIAEEICGDTDLATRLVDGQPVLLTVLRAVLPLLAESAAHDVAKVLRESLIANPPTGTSDNQALRTRLRAGFAVLDERYPDPGFEHSYMLDALLQALNNGQVTEAGALQFIDDVKRLPAVKAALLDGKISAVTATENDPVILCRLRVAARHTGNLSTLSSRDLLGVKPSVVLLREWFATKPPLGEVQKTIRKYIPPAGTLGSYAESRNMTDRSKLWIALEQANYDNEHLEAVGKHGVNENVVLHMSSTIAGANVPEQTTATKRLVTATLSKNTKTKDAANTLTMTLLTSGVAGAGPNAARITLASGGAASGRKPELKKAFDNYISGPSQYIGKGDLRALNELGLFTPKKKSPFATFFGWFKDK